MSHFGRGVLATVDGHPWLQAVGSNDVALLTVLVFDKADVAGAVGVVFDRQHGRLHVLVALEVDHAVTTLVSTSTVAHGHLAIAVAAARLLDRLKQWLVRLVRGDLLKLGEHLVAHAWGDRVEFPECHGLDVVVEIDGLTVGQADNGLLVPLVRPRTTPVLV